MADGQENVFDLLDDDEKEEKNEDNEDEEKKNSEDMQETETQSNNPTNEEKASVATTVEEDQNGDNAWTDVSSTKTRKTAIPVASLFKQQPKQDDSSNKSSTASVSAPVTTPTAAQANDRDSKKKVLRFTREELLALYRPTKCLPEVIEFAEIASTVALEPECRAPYDNEEILRIWNSGDNKQKDSAGRGRGRGRKDEEGYSSQHKEEEANDIWDDIDSANSKTFDLADFSAAAFKFSETAVKLSEATSLYSKEGDDTMESLLKEDSEKKQHEESRGNERGRNLLLQTLAVKTPTESKSVPFSPFKAAIQASTDDTLLDELIEEDVGGISSTAVDDTDKYDDLDDALTFDAADDLDIDSIIGGLTAVPLTTPTAASNAASKPQLQVIPPAPVAPSAFLPSQPLLQQTHQVQPHSQVQQNHGTYPLGSQQIPRPQMISPARPPTQPQHVPMIPQPSPVLMPDKWIYRDPHGNIQGPFEMSAMRRWLESGYFKENLPIKMTRWTTFHPLGIVYPNPETAFLSLVHEPVMHPQLPQFPQHIIHQQQQAAPQQVISQPHATMGDQRQREIIKQEPQRHADADEDVAGKRAPPKSTPSLIVTPPEHESESGSKLSKKPKDPQPVQNPDSKVKQPVKTTEDANNNKKSKSGKKSPKDEELSGSNKNDNSSSSTAWANKKGRDGNDSRTLTLTEIQQQEEAAKRQSTSDHHQTENPPSSARSFQLKNLLGVGGKDKGWTSNSPNQAASLREIQFEQEKLSQELVSQRTASGPPAVPQQNLPSHSQWKAPQGHGQAKPFAEILEEEKLAASSTPVETKVTKGSWAAKAGGSKALESGIPAAWIAGQSQSDLDPTPAAAAAALKGKRVVSTTNNSSTPSTANLGKTSTSSQQNNKNSATSSNTTSTTGSVPSASTSHGDIVDWSVQQLKRLTSDNKNTTDDLALIQFCLTLKSAVEIREYLADYLGSTPQVSQFATEFIRRKEGKQPTQLRATAGGTALTSSSLLDKEKKAASSLPTETMKKKKQKSKSSES